MLVSVSLVIWPQTSTMSANLDVVDEDGCLIVDSLKYQSNSSRPPAVREVKLCPVDNLLIRSEFLTHP